jgi:8-oxo-dGTP diphosphatase
MAAYAVSAQIVGPRSERPCEMARDMLSKAFNAVVRAGLRLAYPILCGVERALGIRTEVATVAVWHEGKLLVIKHSYWPESGLPGGAIKKGESPVNAAARELHEEVGISVKPEELVFLRFHPRKEGRMWVFEYHPTRVPQIVPDNREIITAWFVVPDKIPASVGRIVRA